MDYVSENTNVWDWSRIWNNKVIPSVHIICWLMVHERLLINVNRARQGLSATSICLIFFSMIGRVGLLSI